MAMKLSSPAKVNLFLHVSGRRPDGYHDLVTLMSCVELHDVITLQPGDRGTTVSCAHPEVPENETNLAHRAASLFRDNLARSFVPDPAGIEIRIEKNIPVGAGLGGGSSNGAAVLLGMNRLFGHPFTTEQLSQMGLVIGADVPFFIHGRPAIATGIGERLSFYQGLPRLILVLVYPQVSVSTAEIYKNLDLGLTNCQKQLKSFLLNKRAYDPLLHLCNDLETASVPRYPQIAEAKATLMDHGAVGALMSGSGSAVFGIFSNLDTARLAAENIANRFSWKTFVSRTCASGCRISDESFHAVSRT